MKPSDRLLRNYARVASRKERAAAKTAAAIAKMAARKARREVASPSVYYARLAAAHHEHEAMSPVNQNAPLSPQHQRLSQQKQQRLDDATTPSKALVLRNEEQKRKNGDVTVTTTGELLPRKLAYETLSPHGKGSIGASLEETATAHTVQHQPLHRLQHDTAHTALQSEHERNSQWALLFSALEADFDASSQASNRNSEKENVAYDRVAAAAPVVPNRNTTAACTRPLFQSAGSTRRGENAEDNAMSTAAYRDFTSLWLVVQDDVISSPAVSAPASPAVRPIPSPQDIPSPCPLPSGCAITDQRTNGKNPSPVMTPKPKAHRRHLVPSPASDTNGANRSTTRVPRSSRTSRRATPTSRAVPVRAARRELEAFFVDRILLHPKCRYSPFVRSFCNLFLASYRLRDDTVRPVTAASRMRVACSDLRCALADIRAFVVRLQHCLARCFLRHHERQGDDQVRQGMARDPVLFDEIVTASIHSAIMERCYKNLFALYRRVFHYRDAEFLARVASLEGVSEKELGVSKALRLSEQPLLSSPTSRKSGNALQIAAYEDAVLCLKQVSFEVTPCEKLFRLLQTSYDLCACIDDHYYSMGASNASSASSPASPAGGMSMNADDLLALFALLLVKSRISDVVSQLHFMEDFLVDGLVHLRDTMPGYFLATLRAAMELVNQRAALMVAPSASAKVKARLSSSKPEKGSAVGARQSTRNELQKSSPRSPLDNVVVHSPIPLSVCIVDNYFCHTSAHREGATTVLAGHAGLVGGQL